MRYSGRAFRLLQYSIASPEHKKKLTGNVEIPTFNRRQTSPQRVQLAAQRDVCSVRIFM